MSGKVKHSSRQSILVRPTQQETGYRFTQAMQQGLDSSHYRRSYVGMSFSNAHNRPEAVDRASNKKSWASGSMALAEAAPLSRDRKTSRRSLVALFRSQLAGCRLLRPGPRFAKDVADHSSNNCVPRVRESAMDSPSICTQSPPSPAESSRSAHTLSTSGRIHRSARRSEMRCASSSRVRAWSRHPARQR